VAGILSYNMRNNVRSTLADSITAIDTSITLNKASGIYVDPPEPTADSLNTASIITLVDSLTAPTKLEIVRYELFTDNGDGTITLGACTRGYEGTTAAAFSSGEYAYQAITVGSLTSPLLQQRFDGGYVQMDGTGDAEIYSLLAKSGGVRVPYSGSFQRGLMFADIEDDEYQRIGGLGCTGDDIVIDFPNPATPSTDGRYPLRVTNTTDYANGEPIVVMKNTHVERNEWHLATRWKASDQGALSSNTTIDWKEHDIQRVAITSNSAVTMQDTSVYAVPGAEYRRGTLLVSTPPSNPGYTCTWSANVKHAGGSAPTFTGSNCLYEFDVLYNGTNFLMSTPRVYQL
jgi:hypothetical protein